jgi:HSP20 family molecular chaperone IbpA
MVKPASCKPAELTPSAAIRIMLLELEDEVIMELELPYFVEHSDVDVSIDSFGVHIRCTSADCDIRRTFWRDR